MAELGGSSSEPLTQEQSDSIRNLLWGPDIKSEVFRRWTQAIEFSEHEPSAVVQYEGGPCAVIAPLQSFVLKNLLFSRNLKNDWRTVTAEERNSILCHALADMLSLVSSMDEVLLVEHVPPRPPKIQPGSPVTKPAATNPTDPLVIDTGPAASSATTSSTPASSSPSSSSAEEPSTSSASPQQNGPLLCRKSKDSGEHGADVDTNLEKAGGPKKKRLSHEEFHSGLRCRKCGTGDLMKHLKLSLPCLQQEYGILLVLYSVILTKGIEQIKNEVEDPSEPLIDGTFGHGSQSLINLLITGRAVNNVWDNDKDVSGLKLCGVNKQSTIGFLTQLEHLRYCEVGWYLKNPKFPVWLLGSETHLTVLFSLEKNLISLESPEAEARRIFCNFDPEGRGFVPGEQLGDLMAALNLVSEPAYVNLMREKLDPEQLGIITQNSFMEEFFPNEGQQETVQRFVLMHYNGQPRSCPENKVVYAVCQAEIQEFPELQIITDTSPIKTCLMTKWPTLELKWNNNIIPSLN